MSLASASAFRSTGSPALDAAIAAMPAAIRRALVKTRKDWARALIRDELFRARALDAWDFADVIALGPERLVRALNARLEDEAERFDPSGVNARVVIPRLRAGLIAARWLRRHAVRDEFGAVVAIRGRRLTTLLVTQAA